MGLFNGCMESQAPFIIQISKGARKYTDKRMLEAIIRSAEEIFPDAIFAVHLDHGDEETCYDCIDSGFYSSVMIDASHESFEENIAITKRVVDRAHAKGLSVEAELGMLGGVEEDIAVDEAQRLPHQPRGGRRVHPAQRLRRPCRRHRHQPWRLQVQGAAVPALRRDREDPRKYSRRRAAADAHRHARLLQRAEGRSARINAAGGTLDPSACGVNEEEYLPAAKLGVTKVNIDTDGRLVWTRVHREFFRDHPGEFDFRPPGKTFIEEYANFIAPKTASSAPPAP